MKYYLATLLFVLSFIGCNDGDIITTDINIDSVTSVSKCTDSNTLYKVNSDQALLLNISDSYFPNEVTLANTPRIVTLGNGASAVYRKYSGTVTTASICTNPAPATPVVLEEWNIIGGKIEITTTEIFDTTIPTKIIAYNHNVIFKNVTFVSPSRQEIVYTEKTFGNYRTDVIVLPFEFTAAITQKCSTKNLLFRYNNNEVLLFEVDPALFVNAATPVGAPRERLLNSTTNNFANKVTYRSYNGNLNIDFFCASVTPASPLLTQEWITDDGVAGTSGIIRVETEALNTSTFKHTIKLYKTTFKNGIKAFSPNPDGEYIFGTYTTTN
jgi:hypothetical protein